MSLTTEIEKTKRGLSLEKEMLVQSKLEHCSVIGSNLELQILDFNLVYIARKLRHRPKTYMRSPRLNSTVWKSKSQQQRRSQNLSCNPDTVQCSAHISSSRSPNAPILFFCWKDQTISWNFHRKSVQIMTLAMTFCSDKKIRIVTKSRCGHPLNNQSSNQQF